MTHGPLFLDSFIVLPKSMFHVLLGPTVEFNSNLPCPKLLASPHPAHLLDTCTAICASPAARFLRSSPAHIFRSPPIVEQAMNCCQPPGADLILGERERER